MADLLILAATISWGIVLFTWPIAIVVAGCLWGVSAFVQFRRHSLKWVWISLLGIFILLLAGIGMVFEWDVVLSGCLPSSLRPLFQVFLVFLPWLAAAGACVSFLTGYKPK